MAKYIVETYIVNEHRAVPASIEFVRASVEALAALVEEHVAALQNDLMRLCKHERKALKWFINPLVI